jgi:hypothetical protein
MSLRACIYSQCIEDFTLLDRVNYTSVIMFLQLYTLLDCSIQYFRLVRGFVMRYISVSQYLQMVGRVSPVLRSRTAMGQNVVYWSAIYHEPITVPLR